MKYDHLVKYNGRFYKAGEEVPVGNSSTPPVTPPAQRVLKGFVALEELKSYEPEYLKEFATKIGVKFTDETTHEELIELCSKVEVELPIDDEVATKEYKKSDISRMNVENLKALATELEIEVTDESTGAKLKEEIIAKLGL